MNRRSGILIAAAGLALWAVFALVRVRTPLEISTNDALEMYRTAVAASRDLLGIDVSRWDIRRKQSYSQPLRIWQAHHAAQPIDTLLPPVTLRFDFEDPATSREVSVAVAPNGRLAAIRVNPPRRGRKSASRVALELTPALRGRLVDALAADRIESFQPSPTGDLWRTQPSRGLSWEIRIRTEGGNLKEATLAHRLDPNTLAQYETQTRVFGAGSRIAFGICIFILSMFVIGSYVLGIMRGQINHRSALTVGLVSLVCGVAGHLLNALAHKLRGWPRIAPESDLIFALVWVTVATVALSGVGERAAWRHEWHNWNALRLIGQRKWRARAIGRSILQGFACSGLIAALPFVFAGSGLGVLSYDILYNETAVDTGIIPLLLSIFDAPMLAVFGAVFALLTSRFERRAAGLAIAFPIAAAAQFLNSPFASGLAAGIATAVLTAAILLALYVRHGLLAALMAAKGAFALQIAAILLTAAHPALVTAGASSVLILAALFLGAIAQWRTGEELAPEGEPLDLRYRSTKERLKEEFSLAQQAQQRMLPAGSPQLPGFSLAAACQPARDVGGDLFDYFRLADGRFGVCVADVSGKGMPAALYMTLTKGVIAAASSDASSAADLARHLNRHLHAACKKKMFVTALIGVLDPETRSWEYVRAGHNPMLHFHAGSRAARYLSPPGVGLGLAGPALFDRGLKPDTLQLAPGDVLVLYSDGVTEAMNENLEQYGEQRLLDTVERSAARGAASLLQAIRDDLALFTGAEPAHDDATIVVLEACINAS